MSSIQQNAFINREISNVMEIHAGDTSEVTLLEGGEVCLGVGQCLGRWMSFSGIE